ncbi:MAG: selenoneine biosynthesis selenosugar synthase SenB [Burkholderiales bacterium]
MARISIVTPAGAGTRTGNRHTAQRWAGLARALGHRVALGTEWDGRACDLLVALHARRSHASVERYRAAHPRAPLVVALTGTDLYRDLPASAEARRSLSLADRLVVLQDEARRALAAPLRAKTRVIYQSADTDLRAAPPRGRFRVLVSGHLREEKDPFRAAAALRHLHDPARLEVVQLGAALSEQTKSEAEDWMQREPRYHWLGVRSHPRALEWIARSHLLVVSSAMEGGANVISEAARIGTPVLASRIAGNLGMLGRGYPGYFPFGDERALARLIARAAREPAFYARLKRALRARRALFAPAAERRALAALLRELLR